MSSQVPRITAAAADDGYNFFVRIWDSPQPLGRVFLLHGIISHSGWYGRSCHTLAQAGYEAHFLDRRGSGLNPVRRGEVDVFQTWIRDVADYVEGASSDGLPAILCGISWGGKLAVAVAKSHPNLLHGLVLMCPGIHALKGPGLGQRLLIRLVDRTPLRRLRVPIPLQDPTLFTESPVWQQAITADPLVLRRLSLHAASESAALDGFVRDAAECIVTPTLVMLAGRDRIIDNHRMRRFFHGLTCQKKLLEYPDAAHTFEFEHDAQRYALDLANWANYIVHDGKVGSTG